MKLQKQLLEVCKNTFGRVDSLLDNFGEKIKEVFEERAIENVQVTMHQMKNMFSEFQKSIKEDVTSQIQNLNIPTPQHNDVIDDEVVLSGKTIDHHSKEPNGTLFFWNNRFWEVPKGFDFPTKVNLRTGFEFWLQGIPNFVIKDKDGNKQRHPIRPFNDFTTKMLPMSVRHTFKISWRPVFKTMEGSMIFKDMHNLNTEELQKAYEIGMNNLKRKASYIFQPENKFKYSRWTISTWAKKLKYSQIIKHGTELDKSNLGKESRYNRKHREKRTRTIKKKNIH